jgi:hypothetical protein
MKKILLIVLIVFTGYVNFAQKTVLSEKIEINFRIDDYAVIGKYKNLNAVYINTNQKAAVVLFNSNMEFEKRIELPFIKKANTNIHFVNSKNDLLVFYEQKAAKKVNLFASKLQEDSTFSSPIALLETTTTFLKEQTEFQFSHSEDKQKHLLYRYAETANQWELQAIVVNNELAIETNISQTIAQDDFYFLNEQAISNNGTIYLTSSNRNPNKGSVEELNILIATQNQPAFAIVPTSLNNHVVSDLQLIIENKNNQLYVSGFFSDNKFSSPKGIFYLVIDENKTQSTAHFTTLALQLQNGITDFRNLQMRAISLKKEGGVELIAEKFSQITRTISSGPVLTLGMNTMQEITRTVQEYNYDEVIIFNSLVKEDVKKIVKLELSILSERLTGLKYNIKFDDSILDMISEVGFDDMYGARPLKRAIQDKIEDFISEEVLKSNIQENTKYTLISENGDVKFKEVKKVTRKRKGVE